MKNWTFKFVFLIVLGTSMINCTDKIDGEDYLNCIDDENIPNYIKMNDGFYHTNGTDDYLVKRYNTSEIWGINPEAILQRSDIVDIEVFKGENGYYSLYFKLTEDGQNKWEEALNSDQKTAAFIYNYSLYGIICFTSDKLIVTCVSTNESDVLAIKEHILLKRK